MRPAIRGATRPKPAKPTKATKAAARGRSKRGTGARPRGPQARRPRAALRRRLRIRLPRLGRLLAGFLAAALAGGLIALLNGPWLRVTEVTWAGERFTPDREVEAALAAVDGANLLTVETGAIAERLAHLPAVDEVALDAHIPGSVTVRLTEKPPTFVWRTRGAQLIGTSDGSLIAELPLDATLPPELAELTYVDDARALSRLLTVGDVVRADLLAGAQRLADIEPGLLGSAATRLTLRIEDEYGLLLVSSDPAWRAAFGYYGLDPTDTPEAVAARIDRQVAAVRTLFASQPEAGLDWIDARNPGKVYFRAEG